MTELRKQMVEDLELAGYADETKRQYLSAIRDMARYFGKSPAKVTRSELRGYVRYLRQERCKSASRLRGHLAAIKFLYRTTLGREEDVSFLAWPSGPERLPSVLSPQEVAVLLASFKYPTYRMFATVLYATGLRLNEARMLETRDVDGARQVLHVRHGKGNKERLVPLCPKLLGQLRDYWREVRPAAPYLFEARHARGPVRAPTVRRALSRAAEKAAIGKKVTPHSLRHTCATHLIEAGVDVRIIQALLGHESIRSTSRYTRVATDTLQQASVLLERLPS